MGLDWKAIQVLMCGVVRFSMNTAWKFMVTHPIFSSVSLFLFLLYIFFPSVFFFLVYSSPIIVCAVVYTLNYPKAGRHSSDNALREKKKTDEGTSSVGSVPGASYRNGKSYLKHQRSVRRNARRKVEEMDKERDYLKDEKGKVILTTLYNDLLGRTPHFEDSPKASTFVENMESSSVLASEPSGSFTEQLKTFTSGGGETEIESTEEEEDEEEEAQDKEKQNKAMEWTEDDQKNLMDLGISEIERNKRLESLIARRRARKLFHWAAEKALVKAMQSNPRCQVPQIFVSRNSCYDAQNSDYDADGLQVPGSAPSILLKVRNPFDLPYDPQEEKPDLMGDSFHQEFATPNQKDMFFSRHESFCRAFFPPEFVQDAKWDPNSSSEIKATEGSEISTSNQHLDVREYDHLVEKDGILFVKVEPVEDKNAIEPKHKAEDCNGEVRIVTDSIRNNDSDSSSSFSPRKINQASNMELGDHDLTDKLLSGQEPFCDSSSFVKERQTFREHFKGGGHNVAHSIDSDLQVEVSEIGSPPTTVDENDSDSDREKDSFIYEKEAEKRITIEEAESKPVDSSSPKQPEINLDGTGSLLSLQTEEPIKIKEGSCLADLDGKADENVKQITEESKDYWPSISSNAITSDGPEERVSRTEVQDTIPSHEVNIPANQEEPLRLSESPADEMKITYGFDESAANIEDNVKDFMADTEEKIIERDMEQETKEMNIQNHVEDMGDASGNMIERGEVESFSNPSRDVNSTEPRQKNVVEANMEESGVSEVDENSDVNVDPHRRSPSLSPRSVLVDNLPLDQTFSLTSEDWDHAIAPQNETENAATSRLPDEEPKSETLNTSVEKSSQHSVEDSVTHALNHTHIRESEEIHDTRQNAADSEANIIVEDTGCDMTNSVQENGNSNAPEAADKKEKDGDSPGKALEEANAETINASEIEKDELKNVEQNLSLQQNGIMEQPEMVDSAASESPEQSVRDFQELTNEKNTACIEHENISDSSEQTGPETKSETLEDI